MPWKNPKDRAKRQRERRELDKKEKEHQLAAALPAPIQVDDEAKAFADFCVNRLVVPVGHRLSGQPMKLLPFVEDFLRDFHQPGITEGALFCARKNSKTASIAAYLILKLIGPTREAGFRAAVVSISKLKAAELNRSMQDISKASNLPGIQYLRSPAPGRALSATGEVEIYSLESTGGHSSSLSIAIADEIGLLDPRARPLLNSMRSSVSAKAGRFLSMSIIGNSPFAQEILERHEAGDPGLVVHLHQPKDKSCAIDNREAWYQANPSLGIVKELSFMISEARRVGISVADQNSYRTQELNQPGNPSTQAIVPLDEWIACVTEDPPPLEGDIFLGFDAGGTRAMSAVAAYAPSTGRLRCWACFPRIPDLKRREKADGAPYTMMQKRGELHTFGNRTSSLKELLEKVAEDLGPDVKIRAGAADQFRMGDVADAISDAGLSVKMEWRRSGLGAHGIEDVGAFQKSVLDRKIKSPASLLFESAIKESIVRLDGNGNQALDRRKANSRIDVLSASILAVGLGARKSAKPRRQRQVVGVSLEQLDAMSA